jgi:hypothetical protein
LIDWYKLILVAYKASRSIKKKIIIKKDQAARIIQRKFKKWYQN